MTTRGQNLRSSTPGNMPAAGTRQPGELWMTFPDRQLGYIDASKNAQPAIAIRFFSAAANYVAGDYVVQAGQLYRAKGAVPAGAFNPAQWTLTGGSVLVSAIAPPTPTSGDMWFDATGGQLYIFYNDGNSSQWVVAVNQNVAGGVYLPLGGGTMSGDIVNGAVPDPTTAKGVANKRYVDAGDNALAASIATLSPLLLGDNRIINGDMRIDQRNNGASGTATGVYTIDRWRYTATAVNKGTWGQAGSTAPGFAKSLGFTSSSAYASLAADAFQLEQLIEADMITDFAWGAANAQPVTLSFWAWSSLTGTFSGSFKGGGGVARSCPFSYQIPVASTWTRVVVTIPGDTVGSWVMSGNTVALFVLFDLGCGTTYRGPAGAWAGGTYNGVTGSVSVVGTNGAAFYVTGIKLEIGSVATPFNRQSLAKSLADCQRYYQAQARIASWFYASNVGNTIIASYNLPTTMRIGPAVAVANTASSNVGVQTGGSYTPTSIYIMANATAIGVGMLAATYTADAEL